MPSLIKRLVSLLPILFLFSCNRSGLNPGDNPPNFNLYNLEGELKSLDDFKDKTVLLNFWASWCEPCIAEMPELEKLYQKFKNKNFEIIAIAIDDSLEDLKNFKKEYNLSFEVLLDTKGVLKRKYKIKGYPETYIVKKGKLALITDPEDNLPKVKVIGPREWNSSYFTNLFSNIL